MTVARILDCARSGRTFTTSRTQPTAASSGEVVVSVLPPSVLDSEAIKARRNPRHPGARQNLEIPQQPLDVVELELRAEVLAEAPAQFFQDAPRALHVDLARHLDRSVVAVFTPAQGPPERIGLLLGARRPEPAGLTVRAGTQHALLLHRRSEER